MDEPIDRATLAERTTEIVAAFRAPEVQPAEIAGLINTGGLSAGESRR